MRRESNPTYEILCIGYDLQILDALFPGDGPGTAGPDNIELTRSSSVLCTESNMKWGCNALSAPSCKR